MAKKLERHYEDETLTEALKIIDPTGTLLPGTRQYCKTRSMMPVLSGKFLDQFIGYLGWKFGGYRHLDLHGENTSVRGDVSGFITGVSVDWQEGLSHQCLAKAKKRQSLKKALPIPIRIKIHAVCQVSSVQ